MKNVGDSSSNDCYLYFRGLGLCCRCHPDGGEAVVVDRQTTKQNAGASPGIRRGSCLTTVGGVGDDRAVVVVSDGAVVVVSDRAVVVVSVSVVVAFGIEKAGYCLGVSIEIGADKKYKRTTP